jgi:2-polyprenyl-3-methyl-5-hydroxy-6-metoxy-1,4-benzoquinol methylase
LNIHTNPNFFLKEGYIENTNTSSFDLDTNSTDPYWSCERLATAGYYQFHVYKFAARLSKSKSLSVIADVGCGPAVKTSLFFGKSHYSVSLFDQESCRDICQKQIPRAIFHSVNLEKTVHSKKENRSDLVICSDVLEHLIDPSNCIDLCKRLVTKAGYIVFSTPERDNLRGKKCMASGHPQHVREWNRSEFIELLKNSNLKIVESKLLPQHSLSVVEQICYKLTLGIYNRGKYKSCHLVVCKK